MYSGTFTYPGVALDFVLCNKTIGDTNCRLLDDMIAMGAVETFAWTNSPEDFNLRGIGHESLHNVLKKLFELSYFYMLAA